MRSLQFAAACALLCIAGIGSAQNAQAPAEEAATTAEASQDRVICKVERPTGSRIATKVCKRASVWAEEREDSRKFMQDAQQRTGAASGR